ncbi:sensor histidine kinase N-terminal domain-containing protein [Pelomonas sp. UHG3]|uniref:Sensor histidine kinase N-terminal domain-containing protein n=1 Tax=Roseateles hydrophilus TaxID=2975054 RepID=A0ACC6CDN4_9BURK|nr:sensor histidine kinase N-terminal domain-containing protein [Pelomonas sp. UHG3]MCY4746479.1 sensor histidine kinase N-terminal domain-containing protein [Pelomonas sp. UHG3]
MTELGQRLAGLSMRARLLWGILLPVGLIVAINTVSLYRDTLRAVDTAYDRTLLASAKAIGELLGVDGSGEQARLVAAVPYAALEAFETDSRSRLYFRVLGFKGEMVSGYEDLPAWQGKLPDQGAYPALVDFYDDHYRGEPVRMAVLLQPVSGQTGMGLATIQVAETLALRRSLARQVLLHTLWRQAALLGVIAIVVWAVVQRATRPVRALSAALRERDADDLSPLQAPDMPAELAPLIVATNDALARQARLLEHQKRFVRDASHQLRTPLAVLKVQVQSARQGDVEPQQALAEIDTTVARATQLATQMLALARAEQMRQQRDDMPVLDWADIVRAMALDLAPLIAKQGLDFDIHTEPAPITSHEWALRELTRNLLHNAIQHTPPGGRLAITLNTEGRHARLLIADGGPGLTDAQQQRLFLPFATGEGGNGSGLGLAICQALVQSLGGQITLRNRLLEGRIAGLDACVELPLSGPASPHDAHG